MPPTKSKTIDISIAISELAPLCEMDHYNNFGRIACKLWSQLHPLSYSQYKSQCYKEGNYAANDSMKQKMLVLNNKLTDGALNLVKEVAAINKSRNNTSELNAKQGELYNKLQSEIDKKAKLTSSKAELDALKRQAADLHNIVKSATNVVYGTKNENTGYKFFEDVTGTEVTKRQKFMKIRIATFELPTGEKVRWYLKGIADGETAADEIIEIKNRQKKLFNTVRDYEMCQVQSYLHIAKKEVGYLVEIITDAENNLSGNVIKIAKQDDYFDTVINNNLSKLINFLMTIFYLDTSNNTFTSDEKHALLSDLIRGDPGKVIHSLVYC